ncbi:hypothetical protein A6A08_19820 [Nocardiopsis sp. TSRI0078]|uniref:hypothetical protein n=1 Tax=unclassified Nocardiopsis TaxID=2649073 RepID=UPI000938B537|nr:hypothetical protein [Nocardiopsis sp. TSRI0078]OKI22507.1 hypothetical protein A6A08_19820 [Nocardiopsis sp. TSRI0078]
MEKKRLAHIVLALLTSGSVLLGAYLPFAWSGLVGYAAAGVVLVVWAAYAGRLYQEREETPTA